MHLHIVVTRIGVEFSLRFCVIGIAELSMNSIPVGKDAYHLCNASTWLLEVSYSQVNEIERRPAFFQLSVSIDVKSIGYRTSRLIA
jgi:hypothetical protein